MKDEMSLDPNYLAVIKTPHGKSYIVEWDVDTSDPRPSPGIVGTFTFPHALEMSVELMGGKTADGRMVTQKVPIVSGIDLLLTSKVNLRTEVSAHYALKDLDPADQELYISLTRDALKSLTELRARRSGFTLSASLPSALTVPTHGR